MRRGYVRINIPNINTYYINILTFHIRASLNLVHYHGETGRLFGGCAEATATGIVDVTE
jgi:hypothetical protein